MCLVCLIKGKVTPICMSAFWRLMQKNGDGDHLEQQQILSPCSLPSHQREGKNEKRGGEEEGENTHTKKKKNHKGYKQRLKKTPKSTK